MAASNVVKASIATVLLQINNIDSESEEDELMLSMAIRQMEDDFKVKRRRIEKIENFVEVTLSLYNPSDFKQHFRLTKASFEILINKLYQLLQTKKYKRSRQTTNITRKTITLLLMDDGKSRIIQRHW